VLDPVVDGFPDVVPVVVAAGFFVDVVVVGFFLGVVVAGLVVGRDVLPPPIVPPPVTPPSCCPTATLIEASRKKAAVNTNRNRRGRGVVDMDTLPVIGTAAGALKSKAGSEKAKGL
jgi:hypothetical protein